jgi:hypothetical protein
MDTVRDRLWMFSVEAGTDDQHYGIPLSRMTPIESCYNMGVPNLMMITNEQQEPAPPLEPYFRAMRQLREVAWSIVGSGSITGWGEGREMEILRDLATRYPNLGGIYMDDFFNKETSDGPGTHTLAELDAFREQLVVAGRQLNLWVVLYTHQLEMAHQKQLERMDVINLWTWHASELEELDENFARLEEINPGKKLSLGIYMYDYGDRKEIPLDLMKHQCERALTWLREGRIDSAALLGSYMCDLGYETVEWTREWIKEVGDQPVSGRDISL